MDGDLVEEIDRHAEAKLGSLARLCEALFCIAPKSAASLELMDGVNFCQIILPKPSVCVEKVIKVLFRKK